MTVRSIGAGVGPVSGSGTWRRRLASSRNAAPMKAPRMIVFVMFQRVASVSWLWFTSRQMATNDVGSRNVKSRTCGTMKVNGDAWRWLPPVTCHLVSLPVITLNSARV